MINQFLIQRCQKKRYEQGLNISKESLKNMFHFLKLKDIWSIVLAQGPSRIVPVKNNYER